MFRLKANNLKLRQASMDGVAIAEALELLNSEREGLALSLTQKSLEIEILKEENNALYFKLASKS